MKKRQKGYKNKISIDNFLKNKFCIFISIKMSCNEMSNYGELYIEICKFYSSKKKKKKNKWPYCEIDNGLIIDILNQYKW